LHLDLLSEWVGDVPASVIKVQWTPGLCLIESRQNINEDFDMDLPLKSVVTYEGPIGYSKQEKVKSQYLIKELEKACHMIYTKLAQSEIVLQKATYYFKLSPKHSTGKTKLYLTHCSNLWVEGGHTLYKGKLAMDREVAISLP